MKRWLSGFLICLMLVGCAARPVVGETGKQRVVLPILMYHQISEKSSKWGTYVISPSEFEKDLSFLRDRGYTTVTVDDLIAYTRGQKTLPEKPVMITFDDGYESDYVYAFPLLKKYGMRAVSSTVVIYIEQYSKDVHKHVNYAHLNWDEMREMQASGVFEFQSHSYNLHSYSNERRGCLKGNGESAWHYDHLIREDFALAQSRHREELGRVPTCFTYPFGSVNDRLLVHVREAGFLASLGTYEKLNYLTGDPEELYDLRRFNRTHNYKIKKIFDQADKERGTDQV